MHNLWTLIEILSNESDQCRFNIIAYICKQATCDISNNYEPALIITSGLTILPAALYTYVSIGSSYIHTLIQIILSIYPGSYTHHITICRSFSSLASYEEFLYATLIFSNYR